MGAKNIANNFANIYGDLYNRVELGEKFDKIRDSILSQVTDESIGQLYRVNEDIVKEALHQMQANKHDELFTIASDCLINGPP